MVTTSVAKGRPTPKGRGCIFSIREGGSFPMEPMGVGELGDFWGCLGLSKGDDELSD